jgi:hypothetical protein
MSVAGDLGAALLDDKDLLMLFEFVGCKLVRLGVEVEEASGDGGLISLKEDALSEYLVAWLRGGGGGEGLEL